MSGPLFLYALLLASAVFNHVSSVAGLTRRGKYGRLGTLLTPNDTHVPPNQWFMQLLDHFVPTNNNTWQQRYQVMEDHYVPGGPVFIILGGETEASSQLMFDCSWTIYAKKYNALFFHLEHRFYGLSYPTSDLSMSNLRYLSSQQALADAAYFIQSMPHKYYLPSGTRWIAFGCSYAGNLAAWLRYKYPHLIHGAVCTSGPVLAKTDFPEYMDVVTNALLTYGANCVGAIQSANKLIDKLLKSIKGQKMINTQFRLCDPIDVSDQNDVYSLLAVLANNIAFIIQYNKINVQSHESPAWNFTIETVCDIMVDKSLGDPLNRYSAVNSMMLDTVYMEDCLDYKYDNMIEELKETSLESDTVCCGVRQWVYQTCTEFGYYQTSVSKEKLFGNHIPLEFFIQMCMDVFGESFTKEMVDAGVNRTNMFYGGLDLAATRVVYINGSNDPWHPLSITSTRIPESPAIFINGTSHCADMYPPAESDLPALEAAREEVSIIIGTWIS